MRIAYLLAIVGIILLANFVSKIDFSRTNLPGFVWEGNNEVQFASFANASLCKANLNNLSANTNPPRIPIYFVEGVNVSLMRTAVYTVYDRGVWLEDLSYADQPKIVFGTTYKVTPLVEFRDHIPVVKGTCFVTMKGGYNDSANVFEVSKCRRPYYGFAEVKRVKPTKFAKDGFSKIYMDREEFEKIRELTLKVTAKAKSDYEKVLAIERFLKDNYVYDFNYTVEGDPVYWFLFVGKRGICKHFASAFVVMCNSIGIPARLVVGYRVKPTPENQTVFADQAHAWAEVKFKEGWIEFDPTPSGFVRKIPTTTKVTHVDERIVAGENFTVEGIVKHEKGLVENGFVEIYLKKDKREKGILLGLIPFTEGRFKATLRAPNVTGRYHVVAHFVGSFKYSESWSDPVVEIYERPKLIVNIPERVSKVFTVEGRLSSKFLPAKLEVFVDGRLYRVVETDNGGNFRFDLKLNEGHHDVKVEYRGSNFVLPATYERVIEVGELKVKASKSTLIAGLDNHVAFYVYFNGKPVRNFYVNGLKAEFGGNVTLKPSDVGEFVVNVSAYGFTKKIRFRSVANVRIDYEFNKGLKVYVTDSLGRRVNGTIYVDGKGYELRNGFALIPTNRSVEIYYPGDRYHLPAKVVAKPKPSPLIYAIPFLITLSAFGAFKLYDIYLYDVRVEFDREDPDLPLIWCVNERIGFRVKCRSRYAIKTDGRIEGNTVTFESSGRHRFEVLVLDGRGRVKRRKSYEITIVENYGEAVTVVFKELEETLGSPKSLTAREVVELSKCKLKRTLESLERYVYGKRRDYSRKDFLIAFEEVKSCLRGLPSQH